MINFGQLDALSAFDSSTLFTIFAAAHIFAHSSAVSRWSAMKRWQSVVTSIAIGLFRYTGSVGGIAPPALRRSTKCISACARPTANDGTITEPPRAIVRLTASASFLPGWRYRAGGRRMSTRRSGNRHT
jgi:hypothetical protein